MTSVSPNEDLYELGREMLRTSTEVGIQITNLMTTILSTKPAECEGVSFVYPNPCCHDLIAQAVKNAMGMRGLAACLEVQQKHHHLSFVLYRHPPQDDTPMPPCCGGPSGGLREAA